jgi:putative flippase GtrA
LFLAFAANIAITYFISYKTAKIIIHYLLRNYSKEIRDNVSLFSGMCLCTILNYLGQRFFVFRKKE